MEVNSVFCKDYANSCTTLYSSFGTFEQKKNSDHTDASVLISWSYTMSVVIICSKICCFSYVPRSFFSSCYSLS